MGNTESITKEKNILEKRIDVDSTERNGPNNLCKNTAEVVTVVHVSDELKLKGPDTEILPLLSIGDSVQILPRGAETEGLPVNSITKENISNIGAKEGVKMEVSCKSGKNVDTTRTKLTLYGALSSTPCKQISERGDEMDFSLQSSNTSVGVEREVESPLTKIGK